MRVSRWTLLIPICLAVLAGALAVACGGDDDNGDDAAAEAAPTATQGPPTVTHTPAGVNQLFAAATAAAGAPPAAATPAPPAAAPPPATNTPVPPPAAPPAAAPPTTAPPAAPPPPPPPVAPTPTVPPAPPAASTFNVAISNFQFNPPGLTARAGQAMTISVRNNDGVPHTLTLASGQTTGNIAGGGTGTVQFTPSAVGTVLWRCAIHSTMNGAIAVTP